MKTVTNKLLTLLVALALIVGCCSSAMVVSADVTAEPPDAFDKSEVASDGIYYFNNCSTEGQAGAVLMSDGSSPNGTLYYQTDPNMEENVAFSMEYSSAVLSTFCVWQMDIRFDSNHSGFTPKNQSGTKGNLSTCVRRHDSNGKSYIAIQTGSSAFTDLMEIDPAKWYQVTLRGFFEIEGARVDLYVQAYDENGNLTGEPQKFSNLNRRNNRMVRRLVMEPGTSVDNVRVYEVGPGELTLTAQGDISELTVGSYSALQFSTEVKTALGEALPSNGGAITYELYQNGEKVFPSGVSLSETGLLVVTDGAEAQTLTVRATSKANLSLYAEKTVALLSSMRIIKAGFNESQTRLVNFTVQVNTVVTKDIAFVAAVYDADGAMVACYPKMISSEMLPKGEVKINMNKDLPEDFDPSTHTIKIFAWAD